MGAEGVGFFVATAILALVIGSLLFRMVRGERRESGEILERLKKEYFPKLEANLLEIQKKLEVMEGGEYASLVMRGLTGGLNLEFRPRFEDKAGRLDKLVEELTEFERELSLLKSSPRDEVLRSRVDSHRSRLRAAVSGLLDDVRSLSKLDRLPGKLPVVGH